MRAAGQDADLRDQIDVRQRSSTEPHEPRGVQAGFEVTLLHVLSEAELNPRLWGDVELIDSETAETIKISMTLDTLSSYKRDLAHWQGEIDSFCRSLGVRYVVTPAERSIESLLLGEFRRYGLVE